MSDLPYQAGEYGNTVRVFRRRPGGNIYIRVPDPSYSGGYMVRSLKHADVRKAKATADRTAAELREGDRRIREGKTRLSEVFALYKTYRTPEKGRSRQNHDDAASEMWARWLGGEKNPMEIRLAEWEGWRKARKAGEIDARGKRVPPEERTPASVGTIKRDMEWLRWCFNWATEWRLPSGRFLLPSNPVKGFPIPTPTDVKRPVATRERYEAMRKAAGRMTMDVYWEGRETTTSYLPQILDIVVYTGRRIGAVCALRYADLRLRRTESRPHGAIRWPGDTDKQGKPWTAPLHPVAREAVDRAMERRPGVGEAYLFPAPMDREKPLPYSTVTRWYLECEEEAGLERLEGGRWHPFRRMWASERRHLPDVDVAQAGGWSDPEVMKRAYQHADQEGVLHAVMDHTERREKGPKTG